MRAYRFAARLSRDQAGSGAVEFATIGMMVVVGVAIVIGRLIAGVPIN